MEVKHSRGLRLPQLDGANHDSMVDLWRRFFTRVNVDRMEDNFNYNAQICLASETEEAVDGVALAHDYAKMVMGDVAGIPASDVYLMQDYCLIFNRESYNRLDDLHGAFKDLYSYCEDALRRKSKETCNDLFSTISCGERIGTYSHETAVANAMILLASGYDDIANAVSNALLAFSTHPHEWYLLNSMTEASLDIAVDECLRWDSPIKSNARIVNNIGGMSIELGGEMLSPGELVYWLPIGANHDPAIFKNPERFDVYRRPNQHLTFGAGKHHCMGVHYSKIALREFLREARQTWKTLELDCEMDDLDRYDVLGSNALVSLPLWKTEAI